MAEQIIRRQRQFDPGDCRNHRRIPGIDRPLIERKQTNPHGDTIPLMMNE
jgi:hypothetical protein